jgi:hypothetical protein
MHQSKYLANRKSVYLAALLLISGMSVLGIVVGYNFGYTVTILTVISVFVGIGAITSAVLSRKPLVGFIFGFFLTALLVWVSGIFHFLGGIAGLLAFRLVCEVGIFGVSCTNASWDVIYAISSLIGTLVVLCWIVGSFVLDEIEFDVNANLTVTIEKNKHYPGDDVTVRMDVDSREDFYFRRGVLRLVSWEVIHTSNGPIERALWSSEKRFGHRTHLAGQQVHSEEITIALPKSWETDFPGANWGVRVTLNIPGAKDIQGGQKLDVILDGIPLRA